MVTQVLYYCFGALTFIHVGMALWVSKGPEVFIELGRVVTNLVELNMWLACGYALLWCLFAGLASLDAD